MPSERGLFFLPGSPAARQGAGVSPAVARRKAAVCPPEYIFKALQRTAARLLDVGALLLDRVSLSVRNGWRDGEGRTYVYYAVAEICEDFGCSRVTAGKLLSELEGIGLIERKKQGQGKPDRIYVLQFCAKPDF